MSRRRTYLIQDPYDLDAIEFIRTIDTYFGLRPVCFYTDPKNRFYGELEFPILTSDIVEATYDVSVDELTGFAAEVQDRYEIVGVIPYREDTVEVAAALCELLDLDWVAPEILRRFRDKSAIKEHVRSVDPTIRVPHHRLVASAADLIGEPLPDRFVLKPNTGFGNRSIGIFDSAEIDAARAHVSSEPDETWILEEFIGGVEYHIDGQVRECGEITPLAVYEYIRAELNDYPTVYVGEIQCRTSHPAFGELVDYATRLLTATGLRRCPFHLEVKLDESGPCLVDLGARFPSEGGAKTMSRLHPRRADAFAVAAHDYFGAEPFATDTVDWTDYDRELTVLVYGVSETDAMIETITGCAEIESRPEFVRWHVRPGVGDRIEITRDLRGAPYIVELSCPGDTNDAHRLIDEVHATIRWNERGSSPVAAAAAGARHLAVRANRKGRWIVQRARTRR